MRERIVKEKRCKDEFGDSKSLLDYLSGVICVCVSFMRGISAKTFTVFSKETPSRSLLNFQTHRNYFNCWENLFVFRLRKSKKRKNIKTDLHTTNLSRYTVVNDKIALKSVSRSSDDVMPRDSQIFIKNEHFHSNFPLFSSRYARSCNKNFFLFFFLATRSIFFLMCDLKNGLKFFLYLFTGFFKLVFSRFKVSHMWLLFM